MKLNISLNKYGIYIKFNENKDISSFQFPAANPLVKKTYSLSFQASFQRNWSSNNEYILKNGICSHFILLFRCPNYTFCPTWYIFQMKMAYFGQILNKNSSFQVGNVSKTHFLLKMYIFQKPVCSESKFWNQFWDVWPRASGNFQIEAILEYIDISDSVFTFVLDILTVADGCQLIYIFGNISIITSIYLCIWKQYTDVCTDTIRQ